MEFLQTADPPPGNAGASTPLTKVAGFRERIKDI